MRRPTPSTPAVAAHGESYLSDEEVISKAASSKNGEKFKRLWNVDITRYKSQSEADAALVSILAFWCSGDKAQMDRLFRQSGLMREKWDSLRGADTYGNISIEKAVPRMTDYYKPIIPRSAAEDFGVCRLKELDPMDASKYPWNDIGAGHIFADFFQERLRYVPERKMWFYYEGGVWKLDKGNLRAMKYCMELANLMYTFALEIKDEDKRKSYMKYASRWQRHNNRVNILKDAQVYHPISFCSFDADIYIFNCKNGTLHIDTGEFTEHHSTDLLTKISPVVYDPTAYSERFAKMIANYEAEQHTLEQRVTELRASIATDKGSTLNADHFLTLVRKYTEIPELTAEIIREFVERVYVYKAEKVDGKRVQRIKMIYNCIGAFALPDTATNEKTA
ncbi:MAG: DUF4368 domain-containing protein [Negativicoccus succinicivorans]|uniref:phage NrS-1 polymerase family protein n=1 Tax=Negativicoccus succinicivorans TaxID=620903 RepID=UPI0026EEE1C9|nr:DUF4368 domain-containing protein [Negativicoccus succinicivorans]MBS6028010.1 DUF4368 domain-containing protein [Negativicoccus succinicivorans]